MSTVAAGCPASVIRQFTECLSSPLYTYLSVIAPSSAFVSLGFTRNKLSSAAFTTLQPEFLIWIVLFFFFFKG